MPGIFYFDQLHPVVDVDMGIGRQYGYDDAVHNHAIGFKRGGKAPPRNPATCHPRRPFVAHGLCWPCYAQWWKTRKRLRREIEQHFKHKDGIRSSI